MDVKSLRTYIAAKHQFKSAESFQRKMHATWWYSTVGNAYMLVLADQGLVESYQAQVATAKVSLDQANANHDAGTAPKLDVLGRRWIISRWSNS